LQKESWSLKVAVILETSQLEHVGGHEKLHQIVGQVVDLILGNEFIIINK
jgi:hypothetical protein